MAGDSNTGGGGSVHWNIEATQVDDPGGHGSKHNNPGHRDKLQQSGKDNGGAPGTNFTVTIKVPSIFPNAASFVAALPSLITIVGSDRIRFNLPIEDDKKQIRIEWP